MRPASSNSLYGIGTEDWFGIVNMHTQRPRRRNVLNGSVSVAVTSVGLYFAALGANLYRL